MSTLKAASGPIIEVRELIKYYPFNPQLVKIRNESFVSYVRKIIFPKKSKPFMALENVSFKIYPGESVGIVGKNGAGKSTLLRILSGIIKPSSGQARVHGDFAELFSLNSGFNLQLSGRKNIYLYAAIKNIPDKVIESKMDQIIAFSGLGEFIDMPVKKYSSGMRGRLGFSLIINNLPDTIFIDEALSVGDRDFQQKCIDEFLKMREQQRTFIIVSHSETHITRLCTRALWLEKGRLIMDGEVEAVLEAYKAGP